MAARRPLVNVGGSLRELPTGDTLQDVAQWYFGTGTPLDAGGAPGDYYVGADNKLWRKGASTWTYTGVQYGSLVSVPEKTVPVDADVLSLGDSANGGQMVKLTWANLRAAAGGPSGKQVFDASGTWVKPAGVKFVFVEAWSGGSSGMAAKVAASLPGGIAGLYDSKLIFAADVPSSVAVVVGDGGEPATSTTINVVSNAGGDSSFGSLLVVTSGTRSPGGVSVPTTSISQYTSASTGRTGGSLAAGTPNNIPSPISSYAGPASGGGVTAGAADVDYVGGFSGNGGNGGIGVKRVTGPVTAGSGTVPGGGGGTACAVEAGALATSGAGAHGRVIVYWW